MDELHQKKAKLEEALREMGSLAVAFSAGIDSSFLLKVAHDLLGEGAVAVTARSCVFPQRELEEAAAFCRAEGVRQLVVDVDVLDIAGFAENPPERCYLCKRALLGRMLQVAADLGIPQLVEGSNLDDEGDYRPGARAVAELNVRSPLKEAGLTKAEIRALSKELGLPSWDKPSFACLASRFPYGERITEEKLGMVESAEQRLRELGFRQLRVRMHGDIARIEIEPSEFARIVRPEICPALNADLQSLGFRYVTLDLDGYRMGSMNKMLGR